ncbi:tetraspanin-2-like, partial [Sinocyclocheilus grahami]|uniref:tetraspanin-2-like n=1 Tax=Sinocyclocheilus grahami TaxID=75366 RepID=UPI0007AD0F65
MRQYNISYHRYADDTQTYIPLSSENSYYELLKGFKDITCRTCILYRDPEKSNLSILPTFQCECTAAGVSVKAQQSVQCSVFLRAVLDVFQLVGLGLVALGMWLRFGAETRGFFDIDLSSPEFNIGVMVLVVTGVLMLLVAIIGDCGACNNSKPALGVFSGLLTVLIIIEIAAGVMAFMWSDQVSGDLVNFYATIYAQYLNTRSPAQAVTLELFNNAVRCTHTHTDRQTDRHTHTHT